ncbi:MAG: Gfo/Idh/MocA family protein [Lacipirellulaceae bacterium]
MLRIGIAGLGFMGMVHYLTYSKLEGVEVGALCEKDPAKRAGDWTSIRGNFGPPGEQMDLTGVATYENLDELLADDSIDAIDITLPPALHADIAVRALATGKHVFCEKPMAMTLADCDRMRAAADAAGKQLLVGHVLPYFPEYAWALQEAQSGKHGKLLGGAFKRVISDPAWLQRFWSAADVGGPMLDLHVHDAHFVRLLFGKPVAVTTSGRQRASVEGGKLPEYWNTMFEFGPDGPTALATSGTIGQQGRPFQHAFELHFEKATLVFDFAIIGETAAYLCVPTLLEPGGRAVRPRLAGGDPMDAFQAEIAEVVRSLTSGKPSAVIGADLARDAIELCHAQAASLATGSRVEL